jgi:hypothetical protein
MGHYQNIAIESFENPGEPSGASVRARPLPGQGLDTNMRVECSSKMRKNYPVGTVFIIQAQVIDKEGGTPFLYTHFNWPYSVVTRLEAEAKIKNKTYQEKF